MPDVGAQEKDLVAGTQWAKTKRESSLAGIRNKKKIRGDQLKGITPTLESEDLGPRIEAGEKKEQTSNQNQRKALACDHPCCSVLLKPSSERTSGTTQIRTAGRKNQQTPLLTERNLGRGHDLPFPRIENEPGKTCSPPPAF